MFPRFPTVRPVGILVMFASVVMFATTTVIIEPGDTLTSLAAEHNVTVTDLVEWNDLEDPDRIIAGATLIITDPGSGSGGAAATSTERVEHAVTAGDTLWLLARRYGATVAGLAERNGLADPDRITIGQLLVISGGAAGGTTTGDAAPADADESVAAPPPEDAAPAPDDTAGSHEIQPGETLFSISRRYGLTTDDLIAANGLTNPDRIVAGQVLTIPSTPSAAATSEPDDSDVSEAQQGAAGGEATTPNPVPAAAPATPGAATDADGPDSSATPLKAAFTRWSASYGVPQDLLEAIAWKESNWQPSAVGPNGHLGIGQLSPDTVTFVQERLLGLELDPLSMSDGIQLAARYLRYLIDRTHSEREALAAWNQGLRSVLDNGISDAAGAYADDVLEIRRTRG